MNDWAIFVEYVPWFLDRDATVEIGAQRKMGPLSPLLPTIFPTLAELLEMASLTEVSINGSRFELLAWDSHDGDRLGWLCQPPSANALRDLHEDHRTLLVSFGGVVERFNEPSGTWLMNLNDALTEREASHDASFIRDYIWAFENVGLTLPIEPTAYYSIAREANGNTTFCHRASGEVLMFATDHCFKHLTKLEGCPAFTLYRVNGASTFRDWVNAVASQWLNHVARFA